MPAIEFDEEPTAPQKKLARARILVVEDDSKFRGLVSTRLDRDGYDVYTAATADEALAMMRFVHQGWPTDNLELMIIDQHLPGGSGLEVLRQLRAEHDGTPALLMTAFPDSSVLDEASKYGASVLLKPFSLDFLCDVTIEAILCAR
ncbi:MAG: response regulator [Kofleriaceae bacterium]